MKMGIPLRTFKTNGVNIMPDNMPTGKDLILYLRLPEAIAYRLNRQALRLSCPKSSLARMAIIKLIEEEEYKEQLISK